MLTLKKVREFKEYLESGQFMEDFDYRTPDGQAEMLDMIETLFEICELADEILTKRLYQQMAGTVEKPTGFTPLGKKEDD
ncbi:hypothetical protein G4V39_10815 [Thermosulfuriphilus ammonigenes]|uniref:Uncharacterized protein n=1 Tax=Thermosulfuriphilus ammonigenes TaxID=1936021 RepID=A0A6G7PZ67_9BACT|nr:hypothetical protein [Thermosulfuriphilus ammonigenes]MBA2849053.1 hypothetical protein [Thermosulfuriphilus ammonigenes]QIJ72738.1 hypothetical protein G4V39_10815 [Thermosulfuriphilus ammonigenes]